jgi:hypothetical protein
MKVVFISIHLVKDENCDQLADSGSDIHQQKIYFSMSSDWKENYFHFCLLSYFEKIKVSLCDHHAVCVCVPPPLH